MYLSPDDKGEYTYGSGQDAINLSWIVDPAISLGKSGPIGRAIVLGGGGGFFVDTAWASYQAFYSPQEWSWQERIANNTRAVVPVVLVEGGVFFAGKAFVAGGTYLGRSLLGRVVTGAGAACAARPEACETAGQTAIDFLENQPNRIQHIT